MQTKRVKSRPHLKSTFHSAVTRKLFKPAGIMPLTSLGWNYSPKPIPFLLLSPSLRPMVIWHLDGGPPGTKRRRRHWAASIRFHYLRRHLEDNSSSRLGGLHLPAAAIHLLPHHGSCRGSLYSPVAVPVAPSTLSRRPTSTPPSRLPWRSCIWLLWLWAAGRGSNRRRRFKRSNLGEFRHHLSLPQPLPCSTQSNIQWTHRPRFLIHQADACQQSPPTHVNLSGALELTGLGIHVVHRYF